ncbi:MAG: site-2 protease family protein [Lachnospiraceae bacterium]|nr:site-2 protease family protein [Lachnospiraceae bacterium]
MNIILIILVFGIVVFFHEFGHFIVAKANHIAVTEFSIGMGPAIFSVKKKETKYSLRILPIGGYCMMLGENEESEDENSFSNKPVWARILVIAAGPFFNFILALIFSVILIIFCGYDEAKISEVKENGAAYEAGIEEGDTIVKIGGKKVHFFREVQIYMMINDSSKPVDMVIEKADGTLKNVTVYPKKAEDGNYYLGIARTRYNVSAKGVGGTIKYAFYETGYWVNATFSSLKMIFTGGVKSGDIMGPVGVGGAFNDIIEEVKQESSNTKETVINIILNMLNWCILLSVNLGIMNLLPVPALDGGRLLFLFIEAIRRKKIPQEKEAIVNFIGFALLMVLMVLVFFNDIKNVFFS